MLAICPFVCPFVVSCQLSNVCGTVCSCKCQMSCSCVSASCNVIASRDSVLRSNFEFKKYFIEGTKTFICVYPFVSWYPPPPLFISQHETWQKFITLICEYIHPIHQIVDTRNSVLILANLTKYLTDCFYTQKYFATPRGRKVYPQI